MRLISRHILRALSAPFFWGVAALTGLLLLNSLPPLIEQFGGKGLPASIMTEGVLLLVPALLALTLPMAVLVSTLYAYSQLAAALEMVAMYANGISVWRMARPALVGAAVIALINFFVFDQLVPKSNLRFVNLRDAVMNTSPTLAFQQQVLNSLPQPSGYVLRAERIDAATGAMNGITIFDLLGYEGRRLIIADSGSMAESANGQDLILNLHSGTIYEFKRDEPGRLQQTSFVTDVAVVRNVQHDLDRSNSRVDRGEREKSSCELLDGLDDERWTANYEYQQSEYLTRRDLRTLAGMPPPLPPAAQQRPTFAPHCGIYRRVEAWFKRVMLPQTLAAQAPQQPVPQQPVTQQPVAQPAPLVQPGSGQFLVPPGTGQVSSQATNVLTPSIEIISLEARRNYSQETMRNYQVEYHQKFAVPLSSFCFVLIGMALALKYPGSGIGLVIGGSLVIFLGFYIMLQGGKALAATGHIDPAVAMYSPLLLFTVIGLIAVRAANREMGTARSTGLLDGIADFFRRLRED